MKELMHHAVLTLVWFLHCEWHMFKHEDRNPGSTVITDYGSFEHMA